MPIKVIIITTISSINVYISSTNQLIYYVERCCLPFAKDEMQLTSALQKNGQSIHYLLCGKCMQIAYVAMHTQTLTRDIERKEKIERETTKKYRVQD